MRKKKTVWLFLITSFLPINNFYSGIPISNKTFTEKEMTKDLSKTKNKDNVLYKEYFTLYNRKTNNATLILKSKNIKCYN